MQSRDLWVFPHASGRKQELLAEMFGESLGFTSLRRLSNSALPLLTNLGKCKKR
jgi:hypothetical protein